MYAAPQNIIGALFHGSSMRVFLDVYVKNHTFLGFFGKNIEPFKFCPIPD